MNRRRLSGLLASLCLCVFAYTGLAQLTNITFIAPTNGLPDGMNILNSDISNIVQQWGSGGGGGGSFVPIFNGGRTNGFETNGPTLINSAPFYSISSILYTNLAEQTAGGTPTGCGYRWVIGATFTLATNCNGATIIALNPPTCTNWGGVYTPFSTNNGIVLFTNACSFFSLTNVFTCTDLSGPYFLDTNIGPNAYTNVCLFVIFGSRPCPDTSGPYFPFQTNNDVVTFSNICGITLTIGTLCTNGQVFTPETIYVTNDFKVNGVYHRYDPFGFLFTNTLRIATNVYVAQQASNILITVAGSGDGTVVDGVYHYFTSTHFFQTNYPYYDGGSVWTNEHNVNAEILFSSSTWQIRNTNTSANIRYTIPNGPTNATTSVASGTPPAPTITYTYEKSVTYFHTNVEQVQCWAQTIFRGDVEFYWSTNATFTAPANVFAVTPTEQFYLTNADFLVPDTNTVYIGNGGQQVTFTTRQNPNLYTICGLGGIYGSYPSYGILIFTLPPGGPPGTPTPTNPPCTFPARDPLCDPTDIQLYVGCVCKRLKNAVDIIGAINSSTAQNGFGPKLVIDAQGNATETIWTGGPLLYGLTSFTWSFSDSSYWEAVTSPDPCAYQGGFEYVPKFP